MVVALIAVSLLWLTTTYMFIVQVIKNRKMQTILMGYLEYLEKISIFIDESDKKIREIDYRGTFEADDEVGFFFQMLKDIQKVLSENFKLKTEPDDEEPEKKGAK